jgi:hypothetical protein
MSTHGVIIINLLALGLIALVLDLVRRHRLYVGYAVIWLVAISGLMVLTWFPPLLYFLPRIVGAIFPASALSLCGFLFVVLVLVLFSVQLSELSARQTELAQQLALSKLLSSEARAEGHDRQGDASSDEVHCAKPEATV